MKVTDAAVNEAARALKRNGHKHLDKVTQFLFDQGDAREEREMIQRALRAFELAGYEVTLEKKAK